MHPESTNKDNKKGSQNKIHCNKNRVDALRQKYRIKEGNKGTHKKANCKFISSY